MYNIYIMVYIVEKFRKESPREGTEIYVENIGNSRIPICLDKRVPVRGRKLIAEQNPAVLTSWFR